MCIIFGFQSLVKDLKLTPKLTVVLFNLFWTSKSIVGFNVIIDNKFFHVLYSKPLQND
jgi:hypothetical protein